MRETKFRAWDKEKKVYFPGEGDLWEFSIIGETTMFDLLNQYSIEDYNNLIIEQFTGLQDKNGKDVYENDIGKYWYRPWNTGGMGGKYKTGYIIFSDGCFKMMEIENIMERDIHIPDDIEIIGNIHENPELMGER